MLAIISSAALTSCFTDDDDEEKLADDFFYTEGNKGQYTGSDDNNNGGYIGGGDQNTWGEGIVSDPSNRDSRLVARWKFTGTIDGMYYVDIYEFHSDGTYSESLSGTEGDWTGYYFENGYWISEDGTIYFKTLESDNEEYVGEIFYSDYYFKSSSILNMGGIDYNKQ